MTDLDEHPLQTGNFQLEDMCIVEKVQRNLHSPLFEVGPLAIGDGAGPRLPTAGHFRDQRILSLAPRRLL